MASPQPNNLNFPFYPSPPFRPFHPPPPPSHSSPPPPPPRRVPPPPPPHVPPPPPPPRVPPPPPPHVLPPPPPHVRPPPPPSHPIAPPTPHVQPPPAPLPPSPAPYHPTVIVIVFVSLGGLLFLSLLAFALFCFIKRRKKKASKDMDLVHFDEHKTVKEEIVSGPFGQKVVVMTVDDDVHIDAPVKKKEKFDDGLHAESSSAYDQVSSSGHDHDVGSTSSSGIEHHHHELQPKPTSHD